MVPCEQRGAHEEHYEWRQFGYCIGGFSIAHRDSTDVYFTGTPGARQRGGIVAISLGSGEKLDMESTENLEVGVAVGTCVYNHINLCPIR